VKVFLHLKSDTSNSWINEEYEWSIIPNNGDFFTLSVTGDYYKVTTVLYPMFKESMYDVEIFAVKEDKLITTS
jgi:hypothetical protein